MIQLHRNRNAASIDPTFLGVKRKKKLLGLYKKRIDVGGQIPSKQFDSAYWKLSKEQMKVECSEKCAYCESPVTEVAHGDVEHFRPKTAYWWLAYCYDNFLFSCQICNQIYKNDEFPVAKPRLTEPKVDDTLDDDAVMLLLDAVLPVPTLTAAALKKFQKYLSPEKAILPNPYFEDTEKYFIWEADDVKRTVIMKANPAVIKAKIIFEAVEKYYGINRVELCRLRHAYLRHFKIYKKAIAGNIDAAVVADAKSMVKEMTADSHPFAGMLRYYNKIL